MISLLEHDAFRAIVRSAYIDEHGTGVDALSDDAAIESWLVANVADYFHASSSCRMGLVLDTTCAVRGYDALFVCDASAFSDIPAANPHLAVVMLAEAMVEKWLSW